MMATLVFIAADFRFNAILLHNHRCLDRVRERNMVGYGKSNERELKADVLIGLEERTAEGPLLAVAV